MVGLVTFPSGARLATAGNINRWARVNEDRTVDVVEIPLVR